MAENNRPGQGRDPFDRFDEAISDPRLYEADQSRYEQLRAQLRYTPQHDEPQPQYEQAQYEQPRYEQPFAVSFERTDVLPEELQQQEPVPLFISNYEEEHRQLYAYEGGERRFGSGSLKKSNAGRVVAGVAVVSAIAAVLALFSIDSTRNVIFNASLGGGGGGAPPSAAQLAAAVPEPAQPQRSVAAPPIAAEPTGAEVAAARRSSQNAVASTSGSPSRDEIAAAYQSALKGNKAPEPAVREPSREVAALAPSAAPVVAAVAPAVREPAPAPREAAPVRRIDPDELAVLLKRAKGLLAIGDITSARLLLERAADAQEPEAALMLAGTYDPQVQASQDLRGVAPDPETAKVWYQKAAQLGSADAKRRLGQFN